MPVRMQRDAERPRIRRAEAQKVQAREQVKEEANKNNIYVRETDRAERGDGMG